MSNYGPNPTAPSSVTDRPTAVDAGLRTFMLRECPIEYVRECDENERFPIELYKKLGAAGWLGLPIPVALWASQAELPALVVVGLVAWTSVAWVGLARTLATRSRR